MSGKKKSQKLNTDLMKEELLKWICIKHATNSPLDRSILREKSDELVKRYQLTEFKCSESWLTVFLKRYGFSASLNDQCGPILENYQTWIDMIRGLINQYRYEDQYHMDELSMYTDFIPSAKLKPDELPDDPVDMSALKLQLTTPAMNKITLLLACNAAGTEKLKPIVCGPYSLTDNEKYSYFHNEKSMITDEIISAWLRSLNHEMSKCNRTILLFMSRKRINALKLVRLTHILPVLFPQNFPTELKPLRRDIFHYIKMYYRKLYIEKLCSSSVTCNWQANNITDLLIEAWKEVPRDLIVWRFQRVKFREDDSYLTIECNEWDNLSTGVPFKRFVTFDDDLGESTGQICDDLRFLTRIKHEYNLKTLEIQDSIDQGAAGSSRNYDSPKRPDDDFVDDGDSDCRHDESIESTRSLNESVKKGIDSETILSPATPISEDFAAMEQDDESDKGADDANVSRHEAADDFKGEKEEKSTVADGEKANEIDDSEDSSRKTSTERVDSSVETPLPCNSAEIKMEIDAAPGSEDSCPNKVEDNPPTLVKKEAEDIPSSETPMIVDNDDNPEEKGQESTEVLDNSVVIKNEEETISVDASNSSADENPNESPSVSSSTEKVDDSIKVPPENEQNFTSLPVTVTETSIRGEIQFTTTENYYKIENIDNNSLLSALSDKINEESSSGIDTNDSVDEKSLIDDLQSNLNNYELRNLDKLNLSFQNVDKIVNSMIKSAELHEIVDKTEISSNSDNIEGNSIDLSMEISGKIDDSSMDTLTNDSTNESQENTSKIDENNDNSKEISGVYQTLDTTIPYDTESALQEASRELEEKLRDLEANDLCKKKGGFYCDEDNSESSKNSIETVSILRELLDEARELNDNDEFKGYGDNKYFIDNEQQSNNNLKRKRESSESEDCDKSEPHNKKMMMQDNWAKCFEKFPVFGPYHLYQEKIDENNERIFAAEFQGKIKDDHSPSDENCARSPGPSSSYEKY